MGAAQFRSGADAPWRVRTAVVAARGPASPVVVLPVKPRSSPPARPGASPADLQPVDADGFRQAFRRTAAGVWIVTAAHDGSRSGLAATSVVSLSADPAELLLSLQARSSAHGLLKAAGRFGVNLLAADQVEVAERFSGRRGEKGAERYAGASWQVTPEGVWLLDGAPVALVCTVEQMIERPSQTIVIGRVRGLRLGDVRQPLLYGDGRYLGTGA